MVRLEGSSLFSLGRLQTPAETDSVYDIDVSVNENQSFVSIVNELRGLTWDTTSGTQETDTSERDRMHLDMIHVAGEQSKQSCRPDQGVSFQVNLTLLR
ncbi:unnamed protein product [Mesocestoides corti]|uniref:Cadherin domain-containing protein n=1 Tax=Mesocestoides corti TaxID=53468 RepID=A0A0R3UB53_MESCO|nr:unnamed protein product [Mesocestoides corti]